MPQQAKVGNSGVRCLLMRTPCEENSKETISLTSGTEQSLLAKYRHNTHLIPAAGVLSAIAWLHHTLHFGRWRFRFAILGYFGFGTNGFGVTFHADVWHHSRRN
jgi:hypothetical protein